LNAPGKVALLAPFQVRGYRYQWSADLVTSWAFEMEVILLGWYVLVETESVLLLTVFASLQYIGTLISPVIGMLGDRFGHRTVLCAMRAFYTAMAMALTIFIFMDALTPINVFVIAALMGLVRASDMVMRYSLIGETMPADKLAGALGLARATFDSARMVGALAGAAIVATMGMGAAYVAVTVFYASAFLLTRLAGGGRTAPLPSAGHATASRHASTVSDLKDAAAHVWSAPHLKAGMILAFLLNLTAFPIVNGLLPYVAKQIYHADQTTLGYMVATFAAGAMLGSITVGRFSHLILPTRMMIGFAAAWYLTLTLFALQQNPAAGILMLFFAGCAQTLCLVPLSTMLVRTSHEKYRGRVMGLRAMAVYGLPVGLWISGPLIERYGFQATAIAYCMVGLGLTVFIALRWRAHLWRHDAPGNRR
jgi:predicted MFS family arabinose efflux permease